ncbi:type IVB secretion system protein IcmH/DotU [Ralstonia solanacearum]|uniref:type IVB secretion system protein IcmH/DotU n=1 Tax=Ralstonia solanacearum TaxID=305 RepID=UPI000F60CF5D|nr:type IVB secretion system protein IcmH/DotU [Ralstonia solanacearum]MCL9843774.1 type IVB secretion system protein IcmH/DotU [Ralstonia solanacearum]MDC6252098.1 type IVB secretion system protein IcmH/DotU [Ralstonia solanacearum]MDC6256801.1 type IVB secretion system protein IcmH/DotU [Ralstonia solanacearum]MDC6301341.1 type IVB secretion system protein IcmH/DotU [Ralstonia solanacearum]
MSATTTPSLFGGSAPAGNAAADAHDPNTHVRTLLDLLYDGFFMLFQLRNGQQPTSAEDFLARVRAFLEDFDRGAKRLNVSAEDVFDAKYAFCAAVDETILSSNFAIRTAWERRPLQLELFGEQLAGETFFIKLEELRAHGAPRLQALEVFHMCLLLGFRGKYILEGPEKLAYLTARLGDEISAIKGKRAPFAPHWLLPDKVTHRLKRETPLWIFGAVFALIALLGYIGLSSTLRSKTNETLEGYSQVIKLGPRFSHLTISLP